MVKAGCEFIQAFPVHPGTYVSPDGGATGLDAKSRQILHAATDGTVTFHFKGGHDVSVPVTAGQDLAIGYQCETIDADCKIWVS